MFLSKLSDNFPYDNSLIKDENDWQGMWKEKKYITKFRNRR